MERIDIIRHASEYLKKLSEGVNPIDETPYAADSDMNNERLKKCFSFAAEVLDEVCAKTDRKPRVELSEFSLTAEEAERVEISMESVGVLIISKRLNEVIDREKMKPISAKRINDIMVALGYLINETVDGKTRRTVTRSGVGMGLFETEATGHGETYNKIVFNRDMQKYIARNISRWVTGDYSANIEDQKVCLDGLNDMIEKNEAEFGLP